MAETSTETLVEIDNTGLPVIRCNPDAPATRMSVQELLELEHEPLSGPHLNHALPEAGRS